MIYQELSYEDELKRILEKKKESLKNMEVLDNAMMKEIEIEIYRNEKLKEDQRYSSYLHPYRISLV
jgi:alkyl hydroperoxide reductase subunit AhpF